MATPMCETAWSIDGEELLIELWAERPCLYAVSSLEYSNRNKKQSAYEEIAAAVGKTVNEVKKKLTILRVSFNRAKKPPSSGSAAKQPSKRTEWLLKKMDFMNAHSGTRASTSNIQHLEAPGIAYEINESEDDNDEEEYLKGEENCLTEINDATSKSTKRPTVEIKRKSLKKRREEEEIEILRTLARSLNNEEPEKESSSTPSNPCSTFGIYVSQSLAALDARHRMIAMNEIQNVIFKAQMAQFTPTFRCPSQNQSHDVSGTAEGT